MRLTFAAAAAALALTASAPALALEVGDTAPCIEVETISPNRAATAQCVGARSSAQAYTIIEFFSVTCSYCQQNLPIISRLGSDVAPSAQLRFVSIDRQRDAVVDYIASQPQMAKFPVGLDLARAAKRAYGVAVTPTTFVVDQSDTVVFKHEGVLSSADVAAVKGLVD